MPAGAVESGLQTFVTERSDWAWTVVVAVAVLLPGVGSVWLAAATEAVLVMRPVAFVPRKPAGTCTWIPMTTDWAGRSDPMAHVSVPAALVHPGALTRLTPAGSTSVTVTACAVAGPSLVAVSV